MKTVKVDLGFRPREWQQEVLSKIKRFSVLVVHRRGGKTLLAVMRLIHHALKCPHERGRYAYVGPYLKQAKGVAWDYLKAYAMKVPGTRVNEAELWIQFPNEARITIYGADNPDSMRGLYFDGVVIDEVADVKPNVWGEIIRPCLADRAGWAMFIGTPKGINLFSELYFNAEKSDEWYAVLLRWNDTEALPPDEIESARSTMTDAQWRQEMECDFSASVENQLITFDLVQQAAGKFLRRDQYEGSAKIMAFDVARYGDDDCAIMRRQGLRGFEPDIFHGLDNMEFAGIIARKADVWEPDAIFGDGGRGEGVIDRLRQLGYNVVEVQFGGRPDNTESYRDKRAEMWWDMMLWLKSGGAIPDHQRLRQDLCTPLFSYKNARGVMELEKKEHIKERGLPSPDVGDALALTFAHPVGPKMGELEQIKLEKRAVASAVTDWDPLEGM